ncbi:MAG TPA: hypothetical protein VLC28_04175, partial [Flavitalea sp.]|nr:hypothetical protein [Flavitalea sp.]
MKRADLTISFLSVLLLTACADNPKPDANAEKKVADTTYGRVEIFDPVATQLVDTTATVQLLASGLVWSEGPVWVPSKQMLLFSDVPENKIYQWREG